MLNMNFLRVTAIAVAAAFALTSCATTGNNGEPQTALDRSVNQCVASVVIGAIAGALVGAAAGGKNGVGKGALIGTGGGLVVCAVILAVNNEQDRAHIQQAQAQAVRNGTYQESYVGSDNQPRFIKASFGPQAGPMNSKTTVSSPDGGVFTGPCRPLNTDISIPGKGTSQLSDYYCQTSMGNWQIWPNGTPV